MSKSVPTDIPVVANTTRPSVRRLVVRGRQAVAAVLLGALGGCANISNDQTRTRTEGAIAGAAIGSALGVGLGALFGNGQGREMAAGAAAGALAGGALGAARGDAVARKKAGYAAAEAGLDARLAVIQQERSRLGNYNAGLREFISRKESRLARVIAADYRPGTSAEEFALHLDVTTRLKDVDRGVDDWQAAIDDHKQALEALGQSPRSVALRAEIENLTVQRAELLRNRGQLISIENRIPR